MRKFMLASVLLPVSFLSYTASGQAKLTETVKKSGNEIIIPYEKYVLPNGLTVLIHEDHSDPIVHVDVTYHVGSAREEINKSGFAHFFEHMMFQGSDNVADEEHFKIITEAGGTLNGTTNRDRTNYFETVPANQLEKMLWLEADRMGFLLDAVTQEKFEVQRATVKNERGQRYDNQPYGLVNEVSVRNLYPYGHPYSWLTIGYIEDLNRVDVQDLKNFFLRWYGPNNAVLTIGGDVDPKQTISWVEKYFGSIPKGPEVSAVKLPMPVLDKDRYVSMTDNYAKLPMLRMVFPAPPSFSKDEPALDCLAEIIGQGKNSLFYQNLVKKNIAVSAMAYNSTSELAGEFIISVTPYPGQKLADIEKVIRATFDEFEAKGVTDEDIKKFANSHEADIIYGLESVSGRVSQLASFYTFTGNANYIAEMLKDYTSVTKEDVMRVYRQYIKGKHAVILSVLTQNDADNLAAADNYTVSQAGYTAPNYGYDHLKYNKAKDQFDRSKMPEAGSAVVVNAPAYWEGKIGQAKVIGTTSKETPTVSIVMNFKGGKLAEPVAKNGLANLFATMMNEDTKNYSAEAFSMALDQLGSSISVSGGSYNTAVRIQCLTKNLDATLKLLEERLLNSMFTQEDFDRNKKRAIEGAKNAMNRPAYVASTVFDKLLYGSATAYGLPAMGTEKSLEQISLADIQEFYSRYFSLNDAEVIIVGDLTKESILPKLSFLEKMNNNTVELPELKLPVPPPPVKDAKQEVIFVDVPGAAQTEFRIGFVSDMPYDATGQFYRSNVMNYPLGGAFNSRLNLYLREEKGWTYGARSAFGGDKYTGDYVFSAGIKADPTDSALADIIHIIEQFRNEGITNEELTFTQNSMSQSEARKYETGFQKAAFLSNILRYGLPGDYPRIQNDILKKMTTADFENLAKTKIRPAKYMTVLLVGDKARLEGKLKERGYVVVEADAEGNLK